MRAGLFSVWFLLFSEKRKSRKTTIKQSVFVNISNKRSYMNRWSRSKRSCSLQLIISFITSQWRQTLFSWLWWKLSHASYVNCDVNIFVNRNCSFRQYIRRYIRHAVVGKVHNFTRSECHNLPPNPWSGFDNLSPGERSAGYRPSAPMPTDPQRRCVPGCEVHVRNDGAQPHATTVRNGTQWWCVPRESGSYEWERTVGI